MRKFRELIASSVLELHISVSHDVTYTTGPVLIQISSVALKTQTLEPNNVLCITHTHNMCMQ